MQHLDEDWHNVDKKKKKLSKKDYRTITIFDAMIYYFHRLAIHSTQRLVAQNLDHKQAVSVYRLSLKALSNLLIRYNQYHKT